MTMMIFGWYVCWLGVKFALRRSSCRPVCESMVPWTKPGPPAWLCMNMHPGLLRAWGVEGDSNWMCCGWNTAGVKCMAALSACSMTYLSSPTVQSQQTWKNSYRPLPGICMEGAMQVAWNGIHVQ
jgi:hypothetical protein